jgi:hypothetical protein
MPEARVCCLSDNFIISPHAISGFHDLPQLYSLTQNLEHLNAHSDVMAEDWAYGDIAFFTQNDSVNNNLKFGTPHAEHSIYILLDLYLCSTCLMLCGTVSGSCFSTKQTGITF